MSDQILDFSDTKTAFADKSDAELKEKYRIFTLLNSPFLNALGTTSTKLALSLGLPVSGMIKSTIFKEFCGGENIEECGPVINKLWESHIGSILDYSVEGVSTDERFDETKDEIIRTIKRAKDDAAIPFAVFKVSGIAPLGTLEKMSHRRKLDAKGQVKCEKLSSRVNDICEFAYNLDQPIFIDAEESWIQDAIDKMAIEMMERYNHKRAIIYNTFQLYRTDRLDYLKECRDVAVAGNFILGAKLVRGAYMEKEREKAQELGYPSPIHINKAATDHDYDAAIKFCLDHLTEISFVAGTHNEHSTQELASQMHKRSLKHDDGNIYFSQLYGMGNDLSYVLAKNGYNVSKYLPYGPVKDTIPYLIRRANENSSAAGQVSRELILIKKEMKRRGLV